MGIPEGAEYNEHFDKWGVGERTKDGKNSGLWSWFDQDGVRVFDREHDRKTGKAKRDRHYYHGTDHVLCEMTYDAAGKGSCVVHIDPDLDWRTNWRGWVNRDPQSVPSNARRVEKAEGYPITYRLYDADGQMLQAVGIPNTKEARKIPRALKARVTCEELAERLTVVAELIESFAADAPSDVASRLRELAPPADAMHDLESFRKNSYADYRDRVNAAFSPEF